LKSNIDTREVWDQTLADALIGKVLLVGITYLTKQGDFIEQRQFFGQVRLTDPRKGILLALQGSRTGEEFNLPPDTRSVSKAEPGEYRLRSTGEVVVNPDFTVMFTVSKGGNGNGDA
jgi:hypothetical protein